MTATEQRKLLVIRHALAAIEEYAQLGVDRHRNVDIEALIMHYGRQDNVTAAEAWNAIEESLIAAFHL